MKNAEADASKHLVSCKTHTELYFENVKTCGHLGFCEKANITAIKMSQVTSIQDIVPLSKSFLDIPIPPFLFPAPPTAESPVEDAVTPDETADNEFLIVRVMLTLDGKPWANPQILSVNTSYAISLKVMVPNWPTKADKLLFRFTTTLPKDEFRISELSLAKAEWNASGEATLSGSVTFLTPQSILSGPLMLQMFATFTATNDSKVAKSAQVIGYHKLKARISDRNHLPILSKYPAIDIRIIEIVDQVRTTPGLSPDHLSDFIECLNSIANYMGLCAQHALYKQGIQIDESHFQRELLVHMSRSMGGDIQEAPKQGGGITDIRYRSIVVELKVESKITERSEVLKYYTAQPTQYGSSIGSQLGILCVLDLTEKDAPPAPPQNNIHLIQPRLHGFTSTDAPYPSFIAAFIIDGNLRKPSSYSR